MAELGKPIRVIKIAGGKGELRIYKDKPEPAKIRKALQSSHGDLLPHAAKSRKSPRKFVQIVQGGAMGKKK